MEETFQTIIKSGSLVFFGLIIARFLGYITRIYLARTLSPEGYGLLFLGISIFTLLAAFHVLGLYRAIQRYIAYFVGKDEPGKIKGVILSSFKISLSSSILLAIILFLSADWLSSAYFTPALSPILKVFAFMFPFTSLLTISNYSSIGFKKIKYEVYTQRIGRAAISLTAIALFTFLGFGVMGGALGYLTGTVLASVLAFYFLERRVFPVIKSRVKSIPMTRELVIFSIPVFFAEVMDTLTRTISTIMLGSFTSAAEAGIYQVAYPTSELIIIIPFALASLFVPIISEMYSKEKHDEIKSLYNTLSKWIFYTTLPLVVFFLLFSTPLINIFFGPEYLGASLPLGLLAIGFMAFAFSELPAGILDMIKKTKMHSINSLVAGAVSVVLNYILIINYGILGAAFATAATFIVLAVMRITESYHYIGTLPLNLNYIKALISVMMSGAVIIILSNLLPGALYVLAVLGMLFFAMYFLLILVFRGLSKTDLFVFSFLEKKTGLDIRFLKRIVRRFVQE